MNEKVPVASFVAVNDATDSPNRVHDPESAGQYGLAHAAVPALVLLAHHLGIAEDLLGLVSSTPSVAKIRLLRPVADGEMLHAVSSSLEDHRTLDLLDSSDALVTVGSFWDQVSIYGEPRQLLTAVRKLRPLTTAGLASDELLSAMSVNCSSGEVAAFRQRSGHPSAAPGVPVAFLVAKFVPYLRANFVREQPSLYSGVDLLIHRVPDIGATLEMRGRITRLFARKGRQYAEIETGWFDETDKGTVWARHTLAYALGELPSAVGEDSD